MSSIRMKYLLHYQLEQAESILVQDLGQCAFADSPLAHSGDQCRIAAARAFVSYWMTHFKSLGRVGAEKDLVWSKGCQSHKYYIYF